MCANAWINLKRVDPAGRAAGILVLRLFAVFSSVALVIFVLTASKTLLIKALGVCS